jgi:hypothetical protein
MTADTPALPGTWLFDWYVEASRKTFEQSLETQQAAIDGWASALEGRSEARTSEATPIRDVTWLYDIWVETLQNALVHLDNAITEDGIDLDALQMIWLHAVDDAITDVGKTPEFGVTMTRSVERGLKAQAWIGDLQREFLAAAGVPTASDVEEVGKRLLDLEYRQKSIEDKLDAILVAVETEAGGRTGTEVEVEPVGEVR